MKLMLALLAIVTVAGVFAGSGKGQQAHGEDRAFIPPPEPRDLANAWYATVRNSPIAFGVCLDGFAYWMNASGAMAPQADPELRTSARRCSGSGRIRDNWIDLREVNQAVFK